ncbi:MAG: MHS family MFS transporter [Bacteroidota bacterium]|nr:MHS family MFS transporter [Bacteroidota bacterium]
MQQQKKTNSTFRILIASLAGTTIEFSDFYIYATAAVLVFPQMFFPTSDPTTGTLESLATFALAFFARPVGSALFGHFGDRIGRKATLVASLMTMGICTVAIGLLPGYMSIGVTAPLLLCLFRFGQGVGLGGEWGGAVLLATENAPEGKKAWYGMFPQLGAPLGFILSSGVFLVIGNIFTKQQFFTVGWRVPFIASALLVGLGLYVRLKIVETPDFVKVLENNERAKFPLGDVFTKYAKALILGTLITILVFLFFYLLTVFTLSWGTTVLGYSRSGFLLAQILSMLFFAAGIILSAWLAGRYSPLKMLLLSSVVIFFFGLFIAQLFVAGHWPLLVTFLSAGMFLIGFNYGPLGTALAALFPAPVRYTGASLAFTLAGILGGSLTPYFATSIAKNYGLTYVGYYLCAAALLSCVALIFAKSFMKRQTGIAR